MTPDGTQESHPQESLTAVLPRGLLIFPRWSRIRENAARGGGGLKREAVLLVRRVRRGGASSGGRILESCCMFAVACRQSLTAALRRPAV